MNAYMKIVFGVALFETGGITLILTKSEKESIIQMEQCDLKMFEDEMRDNLWYEVQKVTENEYCVAKFATVICLESKYFETAEEVIKFIEG